MPKYYKQALSLALLTSTSTYTHTASAFHASAPLHIQNHLQQKNSAKVSRSASVSASYSDDSSSNAGKTSGSIDQGGGGGSSPLSMPSLGEKVRTVTVAYIDSTLSDAQDLFVDENDDDDEEERLMARAAREGKTRRVLLDAAQDGQLTFTYTAQIPITASTSAKSVGEGVGVGMVLKEINRGIVSETSLPLQYLKNSLRYVSNEEEILQYQKLNKICTMDDEQGDAGTIQIMDEKSPNVKNVQQGIIVSSIERGSLAWDLGIRAGDMVSATSATVGDKMWPKSTLEGVRSAISSRKVMSSTMQFEFRRSGELIPDAELVQEFELSLSRPMGIHIEDTPDGYVQISGFTDDAPEKVTKRLRVGDRLIAVDSTLGKMWPVSTVEGVVSSVTTRLPGQPVQIRFERVVEDGMEVDMDMNLDMDMKGTTANAAASAGTRTAAAVNGNVDSRVKLASSLLKEYSRFDMSEAATATTSSSSSSSSSSIAKKTNTQDDLLSRCRGILRRYISVHDATSEKSVGVPALVADRVLESLHESSATVDAVTLSLLMNAYIISNQPKDALNIFETAVGFKADGSLSSSSSSLLEGEKEVEEVGIVPNASGLNLITATDVIRAHSKLGDSAAVRNVLKAIEERKWGQAFRADTKCYNIALAAMVDADELEAAEDLYQRMSDANRSVKNGECPKKNIVTYNTMMAAYTRAGMRQEAFEVFKVMRQSGLKPDKYSVTSLIKAAVQEKDFEAARNLLEDMKKAGIETDVVAYNTIIQALCARSSWFEAKELVAEMEKAGVNPDGKTYGLLMNGLLRLNKPGPCLTLFESACSDQRTAGLMENVQLYTTAITAAATLGDYERAFELVSRMNFAGVKPNMKSLTALMGACISAGKYDIAMDVYQKIPNPDGYVHYLAVRASCGLGDIEGALASIHTHSKGANALSGKQVMRSYNYILGSALEKKDYEMAKKTMNVLLSGGYIPSKDMFRTIVDKLDIVGKNNATNNKDKASDEQDDLKFEYLLATLDSLQRRKLQCTGSFYAAVLSEGARQGKLKRRLASIIAQKKTDLVQRNVNVSDDQSSSKLKAKESVSWLELWKNYAMFKDRLDEIQLPSVRVNVNEREIRTVLFAERGVTFRAKNMKKRKVTNRATAKA